jgi:hypothetical protein
MRLSDVHRGLVTAVAAGVAGFLLWVATQVGQQTTQRFWAAMGIVAGAGLVLALSQLGGGWTKWGRPRLATGVFLLGFLPVLVCTGWILLATQPGTGWQEGRLVSWSESIGIYGVVHAIGLYHGVIALGFGLVLGYSFDTTGPARRDEPTVPAMDDRAADEPLTAERSAVVPLTTAGSASRERELVGGRRTDLRRVEIREDGKRVVPQDPDPLEDQTA